MDRDRPCWDGNCNGRSFECREDGHLSADNGARRRGARLMINVRLVRTRNQLHGSIVFVCIVDCYPDGNHPIRAVHGWPVTARPGTRRDQLNMRSQKHGQNLSYVICHCACRTAVETQSSHLLSWCLRTRTIWSASTKWRGQSRTLVERFVSLCVLLTQTAARERKRGTETLTS